MLLGNLNGWILSILNLIQKIVIVIIIALISQVILRMNDLLGIRFISGIGSLECLRNRDLQPAISSPISSRPEDVSFIVN